MVTICYLYFKTEWLSFLESNLVFKSKCNNMYVCVYVCMCVCMYVWMCMYVCMHAYRQTDGQTDI